MSNFYLEQVMSAEYDEKQESKIKLCIKVATLYYTKGATQNEIAKELNISRPKVSRLLQYALDKQIVQIKIIDPLTNFELLERKLEKKYNLKRVFIASCKEESSTEILHSISACAANYLNNNVQDGDIIGVCWGRTIYNVAKLIIPRMVKGVQIVQLKGGVTQSAYQTHAKEIVDIFTRKFNAIGFYHPLPTIFASVKLRKLVEQDPYIKSILDLAKKANIAIFTVGSVGDDALLLKLGYFSNAEKKEIIAKAKGDICSRLIDENGDICNSFINNRTNSIGLEELKEKDQRILVAGGKPKLAAIKAALNGGYPNILITDQFTALELV